MLLPPPKRGKGVRRLNRKPIYMLTAVGVGVVLVLAYTGYTRAKNAQATRAAADAGQTQGSGGMVKDVLPPPHKGAQQSSRGDQQPRTDAQRPPATSGPTSPPAPAPAADLAAEARVKAWQAYYQQAAAIQQAKDDATAKAMAAPTGAAAIGIPGAAQGGAAGATYPGAIAQTDPGGGLPVVGIDRGAQAEKRAFLNQGGDPLGLNENLAAVLHDPKLDTILQGTAIPGIMIGGLTSDMPGMIVGEVSANIYDSAAGNDLLIPQGSRVVGTYDNSVSGGQERIGAIWNRIIFPDTSSIQLGSMEGADQGGYAGFHDQVNTHFWDKFLSATVISIAGATAQLSQPQQSALSGYSPTSVGAGAMTQGYSNLGQKYAEAGLSIPNTLEVRPGYVFMLMVAKDVHLPVYHDRRNARPTSLLGQDTQ
jgi:type IV secretion system protein VirB10